MDDMPTKIAFRLSEAAKAVGLSRSTLYGLLKAGELRSFKVGAATLIGAEELRRFVATREAADGCGNGTEDA